jgi:hypothetical protein
MNHQELTTPLGGIQLQIPPPANWRIMFGSDTTFTLQVYIPNPPNRFQRWMMKKVLGITWKKIDD